MSDKIYKSYTINVLTGQEIVEEFTKEEWEQISKEIEQDTDKGE